MKLTKFKNIHRKNIILGICRYLTFFTSNYFFIPAFDVNLPYWTLMAAVTGVYFLASSMPSFQFLGFAIKVVSPYISCPGRV
jgi:uncharacterized membrane protein YdcZ (DUF606 family)